MNNSVKSMLENKTNNFSTRVFSNLMEIASKSGEFEKFLPSTFDDKISFEDMAVSVAFVNGNLNVAICDKRNCSSMMDMMGKNQYAENCFIWNGDIADKIMNSICSSQQYMMLKFFANNTFYKSLDFKNFAREFDKLNLNMSFDKSIHN